MSRIINSDWWKLNVALIALMANTAISNPNGAPSGGLPTTDQLILNQSTLRAVDTFMKQLSSKANEGTLDPEGASLKVAADAAKTTAEQRGQQTPTQTNETKSVGGFSKLNNFASGWKGSAISAGLDIVGSFIKDRPEYSGKHGSITKNMDTAYDATMQAVSKIPGWGQAAGLIMGAGKVLNKAVGRIGGGTDGMTKADAILGSNFLGLTPLGLINGFGGQKADTYTRNAELDKSTNGGFQGFLSTENVTEEGAGKKYGLFSSGARHKLNELTEFTLNMKRTISGIVDTNTLNSLAALGSTPFISQRQSIDLNGGIQQMRAARKGMLFSRRVVSKYLSGNKLKRYILTIDIATGKYVNVPTDLTKEQIDGKLPIRLANGTVVFMLKNGTVTSDKWETVGEREHLTPKGLNGFKIEDFRNGGKSSENNMVELFVKAGEIKSKRNEDFEQRFKNEFPMFNDVNFTIVADPDFTREKTGIGSIEYFGPKYDDVKLKNGSIYQHPNKGGLAVVYNPNDNTYEDVRMDLLFHGMRDIDPAYRGLVEGIRNNALLDRNDKNKVWHILKEADHWYDEDAGFENRDPYEQYVDNTIDGVLRNYYSNYTDDLLKEQHYVPRGLVILENTDMLPYLKMVGDYLGFDTEGLRAFKEGGLMNVIPEGALHARLHHLDLVIDENDVKQITHKGIPVITIEKDGKIIQHAEIEHSEIILTKLVTDKIENLRKKYHEDNKAEYAIEAGKILVYEILHNTDDRTNLIKNVE